MVVAMGEKVQMAVRMEKAFMNVHMLMDQVHQEEQAEVIQDVFGGALGCNGVTFLHDQSPVGNLLQDGKIMGSRDDRLADGMQLA